MVCINRNPRLTFTHIIDIPGSSCTIATAKDTQNRIKIYLITRTNGRIYERKGINSTWLELDANSEVRPLIEDALDNHRIPRFSTESVFV